MQARLFSPRVLWSGRDSEGEITIKAQSLRGEILIEQEEARDTGGGKLSVNFDRSIPERNAKELKDKFCRVINKVETEWGSNVMVEPTSPIPLDVEEGGAKLFCNMVEGVWEINISTEDEDVEIKAKVRNTGEVNDLQDNWNEIMDDVGGFFREQIQ